MNILFITHPYPNYVPDLLLHGLRKLLGSSVVDYPRKDCLYNGVLGLGVCPDDQICPNWFPPDNNEIDRNDIPSKIKNGFFNYIISDIRSASVLQGMVSQWPDRVVILDGEDLPVQILPGPFVICRRETDGTDFSIPLPMALPEEIFKWITSFDSLEKSYSVGFLGSAGDLTTERGIIVEQIAKHYPDSLLQTSIVPTDDNPNPSLRLGRNDYYMHLQKCRIVLNLPGAGYDTFRFWENAACNAVQISQKMPLFIPNDFEDRRHIFRFSDIDSLRKQIDSILDNNFDAHGIVEQGRAHLLNFHMTTKRAAYLIDRLNRIYG
jgi:hypothetical protein